MKRLIGRHTVITGASRGIGRAIAELFAKEGSNITLIARQASQQLTELVQTLQKTYPEQTFICRDVDVSSHHAVREMAKETLAVSEGIDVLINSAGIVRDKLVVRMKEEDWDAVMDTNLKSLYNLVSGFLRNMIQRKKGKIIALGSVVGHRGNGGQVNYAASKAGLTGLVKSLAREVGSKNILVNGIAPGWIDTDMTRDISVEKKQELLRHIPLGRVGLPEEVAKLALFLASDDASYITGQIITVDGGWG